jgi:hypothetical protein
MRHIIQEHVIQSYCHTRKGESVEKGDVAEAMMILLERGEKVTVRNVREVLGHGSFRDIGTHIKALMGEEERDEEILPFLEESGTREQAPAPTPAPIPDPYATFARVQALFDRGLALDVIAAQLTADGVRPLLGAAAWTPQVVDRVLVHAAAAQRGQQR